LPNGECVEEIIDASETVETELICLMSARSCREARAVGVSYVKHASIKSLSVDGDTTTHNAELHTMSHKAGVSLMEEFVQCVANTAKRMTTPKRKSTPWWVSHLLGGSAGVIAGVIAQSQLSQIKILLAGVIAWIK
jgi:hypothetical protein